MEPIGISEAGSVEDLRGNGGRDGEEYEEEACGKSGGDPLGRIIFRNVEEVEEGEVGEEGQAEEGTCACWVSHPRMMRWRRQRQWPVAMLPASDSGRLRRDKDRDCVVPSVLAMVGVMKPGRLLLPRPRFAVDLGVEKPVTTSSKDAFTQRNNPTIQHVDDDGFMRMRAVSEWVPQ